MLLLLCSCYLPRCLLPCCRVVLKEAMARAEEQQRQQLRQQAEQLAAAHAEMTVRERAERLAKLDAVRAELNALEAAFQRRRWVGGRVEWCRWVGGCC